MKTDEEQGEYITDEEVNEGLALLHGDPSVEIEPPRQVIERREGELVEVERSAFIKLYTSFKKELKDIEGDGLKVWIFLALSVNRDTKRANPGLRAIAEGVNLSVNTVRKYVEKLDEMGLLEALKEGGKTTSYRPADYVSVSKFDTPTVSKSGGTVSKSEPTVSSPLLQNAQLEELELTKVPLTIENAIATNQPVTEKMARMASLQNNAPRQFENALGFSKPLAWWSNKQWTAFAEWVCERYAEDRLAFGKYNIWRNTKYTKGGMTNGRIRGFPDEFYDSWDMFIAANPPQEKIEQLRQL